MEPCQMCTFASVRGVIVNIEPVTVGAGCAEGCLSYLTVEDDDGNTVTILITPDTFVADWMTLRVGMRCGFWYRTDAPMPLIFPPRYTAVVAAELRNDRMVDVSFYNADLINEEMSLQLNLDKSVKLRTTNNQYFQGNPAGRELVVLYANSTRSIPAQTTPGMIIVLCDLSNE